MRRHFSITRFRAFTLVELLVVIAIIALLIALILPSLEQARLVARTVKCLANQRQIAVAYNGYINDNNQWYTFNSYSFCSGAGHFPEHSGALWAAVVAQYAQQPYITEFGYNNTLLPQWAQYPGVVGIEKPAQGIFKCPEERFTNAWGSTMAVSYLQNSAPYGFGVNDTFTYDYPIWYPNQGYEKLYGRARTTMVAMPARTLWIADGWRTSGGYEYIAYPMQSPSSISTYHSNGGNVLWADGHATWQREGTVVAADFDRRAH